MGQIQVLSPPDLNSKSSVSSAKMRKASFEVQKQLSIRIDKNIFKISVDDSATIGYLISEVNRLSSSSDAILALKSENSIEILDFLLVSYEKSAFLIAETEPLVAVFTDRVSGIQEITNYSPIKVIGKGGFSTVTLVREKSTSMLYAVKTVNKDYIIKQNKINHILDEKKILSKISHPFIIEYFSSFQTVNNI